MSFRGLTGRVALVTGAGSGIGAATALRLAAEGCHVALVDRDAQSVVAVAESCPGQALAVTADVSREADVARYLQLVLNRFGRIDLLHLNAGISGPVGSFAATEAADYDQVIAVNQRSVFLGLRDALRYFGRASHGGAVVVTSSLAGLRASPAITAYTASKHAVIGLARSAALEGARLGVRVHVVAPGLIETPLQRPLADALGRGAAEQAAAEQALRAHPPLGRIGTPAEVAALVAFLLSEEVPYMTGGVHIIDGGVDVSDPMQITS
jgi:NAD(P)-dependent dehydrogenase (short-subunit alcohol dehydrogenase family)